MNEIESKKIRSLFIVKSKRYLSPHLIRIVFEMNEEQLVWLSNVRSGSNNKLFFSSPSGEKPQIRTYTNRKIDLTAKELSIDFVHHGEAGLASAWAIHAKAGDHLEIGMKQSLRPLVPLTDRYLLIGDATALPVISAILEELPANTEVKALIEVATVEDELELYTDADLDLKWIHNLHPEMGSDLVAQVKTLRFENEHLNSYIYLAAEYTTVKNLRTYFRVDREWNPKDMYACSYWRIGVSEGDGLDRLNP